MDREGIGEGRGNYVLHFCSASVKPGRFSWNSGMFIFRAGVVLKELRAYAPEIIEPLERSGSDVYPQLPKKSIDYALMEKTGLAYVLPVEFGWDDLGDWNAIDRYVEVCISDSDIRHHTKTSVLSGIQFAP